MPITRRTFSALTVMGSAALITGTAHAQAALAPAEAEEIAREAWQYGYAILQGYQTMFNQTQNSAFPGYVGGFNRFRHYARAATPADVDIVTPNNDTPYSWAWLDLRAEPIVLSPPEVPAPRYFVNQWFDMYTHNFAYTGARTTGREAGTYLFVGPRWTGEVPDGIDAVFTTETRAHRRKLDPSAARAVGVGCGAHGRAPGLARVQAATGRGRRYQYQTR